MFEDIKIKFALGEDSIVNCEKQSCTLHQNSILILTMHFFRILILNSLCDQHCLCPHHILHRNAQDLCISTPHHLKILLFASIYFQMGDDPVVTVEQLKRGVIVDDEVVKKKDGVLVDGVFGVVDRVLWVNGQYVVLDLHELFDRLYDDVAMAGPLFRQKSEALRYVRCKTVRMYSMSEENGCHLMHPNRVKACR